MTSDSVIVPIIVAARTVPTSPATAAVRTFVPERLFTPLTPAALRFSPAARTVTPSIFAFLNITLKSAMRSLPTSMTRVVYPTAFSFSITSNILGQPHTVVSINRVPVAIAAGFIFSRKWIFWATESGFSFAPHVSYVPLATIATCFALARWVGLFWLLLANTYPSPPNSAADAVTAPTIEA